MRATGPGGSGTPRRRATGRQHAADEPGKDEGVGRHERPTSRAGRPVRAARNRPSGGGRALQREFEPSPARQPHLGARRSLRPGLRSTTRQRSTASPVRRLAGSRRPRPRPGPPVSLSPSPGAATSSRRRASRPGRRWPGRNGRPPPDPAGRSRSSARLCRPPGRSGPDHPSRHVPAASLSHHRLTTWRCSISSSAEAKAFS